MDFPAIAAGIPNSPGAPDLRLRAYREIPAGYDHDPYLAAAVLAGLLANTWFGLWWADPVIALGIAALAVHEGREAWEGEEDDDD